jgi:Zn-dependent protease
MDLVTLVFYFLVIIPSSIIHEYAHGWMAERLGDSTARYAGRLTINPLAHIDWWGSIFLPLMLFLGTQGRFMFAYAKPVPYNPYNLKNQRWGPAVVGIAGPLANLLLALSFAMVLRVVPASSISPFLGIIVYANILLMVFNLVQTSSCTRLPIPHCEYAAGIGFCFVQPPLAYLKKSSPGFAVLSMLAPTTSF